MLLGADERPELGSRRRTPLAQKALLRLAITLERAAAFCRVTAAGCTSVADDLDATTPERASELTRRALRLSTTAGELMSCARLWRLGALD